MQLLARFDTGGWDGWKTRFDDDAEGRAQHGLTLLQLWRVAEAPDIALALFDVNDQGKARAWIDRQTGLGRSLTAEFLKTAL